MTPTPDLSAATNSAIALGVSAEAAQAATAWAARAGALPTRHYHTNAHFDHVMHGAEEIVATLTERGITEATATMMAHVYRLAGRDHDIVYANMDGSILPEIRDNIAHYADLSEEGFRLKSVDTIPNAYKQNFTIVTRLFGLDPSDAVIPYAMGNELLSALHSLEANPGLSLPAKVALVAFIQATIPFGAPDSIQQLAKRIADGDWELPPEHIRAIGLTAAHLANRDVSGFVGQAMVFQHEGYQLLLEVGMNPENPQSIVEKTSRRVAFLRMLLGDEKKPIFHNYTDGNVSLLTEKELDELSQKARRQMEEEAGRLERIVQRLETIGIAEGSRGK